MNNSDPLPPEFLEMIEEEQRLAWEEVKKQTDHMEFYHFLTWWYELEVKYVWYFYPIWKDSKKEEWGNKCKAYLKRFGDEPPMPEDYKFEIQKICEQPNGSRRSVLHHMSILYRYAFLHGVRLGKLVGQPPFSTRDRLAIDGVRKEVIRRFTKRQNQADIIKKADAHPT